MRQPMQKTTSVLITGLITFFLAGTSLSAAEWGSLKGRFLVDGTAAKPAPIAITKDPEYCGQHKLVSDSVVVGKDNCLVNAVVFLRAPFGKKVGIHPDYD